MVNFASFSKPEVCSQTVLPDMANKLVENAKIQKFKCAILKLTYLFDRKVQICSID